MSYLGTLVTNTQAVASVPRIAEPALDQHVEIESPASLPASAPSEHVRATPQQPPRDAAQVAPTASVEDALRAAFEWVSPRPTSPAITAETEQPAPMRSAALEVRAQSVATPMEATQVIDTPPAPQPLERHARAIAMPALSQAIERIDTTSASSESVELTTFESTMPTLEAKPRRRAVTAKHVASHEAAPAEEQEAPTRPSPVQVRIGTISLNVRTPARPAPAPKATAPVAAPAAQRPAASAPFAFSARRHHLRWG